VDLVPVSLPTSFPDTRLVSASDTHDLNETRGHLVLRRPPYRRLEVIPRLGIVELNGAQSSCIEQPPDCLRLVGARGEDRTGNELVGLVVLVLSEVRSEEEVHDGALGSSVEVRPVLRPMTE
jgi:hypothetical protein